MASRDLVLNPNARGLTPTQQAQAAAIRDARARFELEYFAKIRLRATHNGTNLTIPTQQARGFAYQLRNPMDAGGYTGSNLTAAPCDTNLVSSGQTNNGANLLIKGTSVQFIAGDPKLALEAGDVTSIKLVVGAGDDSGIYLPPLSVVAGGSGPYGSQVSPLMTDPVSRISSGNPMSDNIHSFRQKPIRWSAIGKNSPDSIVNLVFNVEREKIVTVDNTAASPETIYAEFLCRFYCDVDMALGLNGI